MTKDNPYRLDRDDAPSTGSTGTSLPSAASSVGGAADESFAAPSAIPSGPPPMRPDVGVQSPSINQVEAEKLIGDLRAASSLPKGIALGFVATVVGSSIWAGVTVATGYQIGWMAVGLGFLVGYAVRVGGRGFDNVFGLAGAALALIGCVLSNLFSGCYFVSAEFDVSYWEVVSNVTPAIAMNIIKAMFQPMDLLFYGIALYEGYRFSFRTISEQELESIEG